jgi:hypothetical protein
LKNNLKESSVAGKDIPFIAILRVSESGKKPDHNTKTWDHVIKHMKLITQMHDAPASSNSKVSSFSVFGSDKRDEMGQVSDPRIDKHKIGDNDL